MFSKDLAERVSAILSSDVEKEFNDMLDELLASEQQRLSSSLQDNELRAAVARIELLRKLKNYKIYLSDVLKHGY